MSNSLLIIFPLVLVVMAWNLYKPFREKLRGWSTVAEGLMGTVLTYFGVFAEAVKEGQTSGYIPENFTQYVPMVLFLWVVMKRFQTKTPIGKVSD